MTKDELRALLHLYKRGKLDEQRFIEQVASMEPESLGFATVDHHRELRQGFPEVIFCPGKKPAQVAEIALRIVRRAQPLLATRADELQFRAVKKKVRLAKYNAIARTITANEPKLPPKGKGIILVVTAGTSDIPVAEEAVVTARMCANPVEKLFDVGVAGIHRLLSQSEKLRAASVIIVVAGMEIGRASCRERV